MALPASELLRVLPPPHVPREAGASLHEWNAVFAAIGTRLPEDYVQFINRYGTGIVCGFFHVLNPFAANEHVNLLSRWTRTLSAMASLRANPKFGREMVPFPLYFEPGGLFPWGTTDNGEDLFWKTAGDPDRWTVVVIGRACGVEVFDHSMSQFLKGVLEGSIRPEFLPANPWAVPFFDGGDETAR
jgi:hypothetical protein